MAKTDDIISLTELFKLSKTGVKIKKQKRITINQFRCVLIDIFFLFPEMWKKYAVKMINTMLMGATISLIHSVHSIV